MYKIVQAGLILGKILVILNTHGFMYLFRQLVQILALHILENINLV